MALSSLTAERLPGIYQIVNTVNGKRYIGQSAHLDRRWQHHQSYLRRGAHFNSMLQRSWGKHGAEAFRFEILGVCASDSLTFFEQAWMDARKPEYNVCPAAGSTLGRTPTPEHKARISAALRGRHLTPEQCARIGEAKRGQRYSDVARQNMRLGQLGRTQSPETRAKLSAIKMGNKSRLGMKHSPETLAKMSAASRGHKRNVGLRHSPETITKMKGREFSLEHRARLSAAAKRRYQK